MKKQFIIELDFYEENDFSSVDLEEAIKDGIENVGNYELKEIKTITIK